MRRPFLIAVSFYAIGLLLAQCFQPSVGLLLAASFIILALFFVLKKIRPLLISILLVLAGWTNLIVHTAVIAPDDLRHLVGDQAQIATVRGTLLRTPQIKITERRGGEVEHSLAEVRVSEIRMGTAWQLAYGKVMVSAPGVPGTNYFTSQSVEVSGVIDRPGTPLAPGLFNFRTYLQERGIDYELKAESANDWKLGEPVLPGPPLTDRFLDWSQRTLALGQPQDETMRLLWAMTLGWHTAFTGDISDPFLRAGTMHLFAIDGLRIALIAEMLVTLLRIARVSRAWCGVVAVPAIWFYTAATGWESSAVRASVMMTVVLGGWALKRPADLLNSLGGAGFLILLWDPRQFFEASFQLSFFVMLSIGLLLPKLNHLSDKLLSYDPFLPPELVSRPRRALTWVLRILARYFSLSLAAWAGSIPLSALYFHLLSPISPVANLVAVPLGTFALMANLGALICGTWFPVATELFNNAAWLFMAAMTDMSEWFTKIPGSYFYVPAPSWAWVGVYYVVLTFALSGALKKNWGKVAMAGGMVIVAVVGLWQWEQVRSETEITVLPLEGGHAVYVDATGRRNDWLMDCGNAEAVDYTLKPFLRAQGVNKIPRLALTEGDAKNCGGAQLLNEDFGVGELWTSPVHFRSAVYNQNVALFENSPSRHKYFNIGNTVGEWQVLWPPATNDLTRADDNALVLLGTISGTKILLLSDLSRVGQSALLTGTNDLHADIIVAGLASDGETISDAMIGAVQPKVIVIADSEYPPMRRASRKVKERLEQTGVTVIYTRDSGAVTISVSKKGWKLQAMEGNVLRDP